MSSEKNPKTYYFYISICLIIVFLILEISLLIDSFYSLKDFRSIEIFVISLFIYYIFFLGTYYLFINSFSNYKKYKLMDKEGLSDYKDEI